MDMKRKLDTAISEAERFLQRAKAARASFRMEKASWDNGREHEYEDRHLVAAAKRSSMDLTKVLAELRKSER